MRLHGNPLLIALRKTTQSTGVSLCVHSDRLALHSRMGSSKRLFFIFAVKLMHLPAHLRTRQLFQHVVCI